MSCRPRLFLCLKTKIRKMEIGGRIRRGNVKKQRFYKEKLYYFTSSIRKAAKKKVRESEKNRGSE